MNLHISVAFGFVSFIMHDARDEFDFATVKALGRLNMFPAQSLSVSGGFCVICTYYIGHSP